LFKRTEKDFTTKISRKFCRKIIKRSIDKRLSATDALKDEWFDN